MYVFQHIPTQITRNADMKTILYLSADWLILMAYQLALGYFMPISKGITFIVHFFKKIFV